MSYRVFKQVPRVLFGNDCFGQLDSLVESYRKESYVVFLLDYALENSIIYKSINKKIGDHLFLVDTSYEPKVSLVDELRDDILSLNNNQIPDLIVGIGGGSTLDVAKAISVLLTNKGSAALYQGWDLVKNNSVPKIGIPTLSGTGAEASRTAVLSGPKKKFGINSDHSMFDLVLLDSKLIKDAPREQRFYTAMDCYIHCVESLQGSYINSFGRVQAQLALNTCEQLFLKNIGADEDLMIASFFGGASIANSEVGVVHAMSYGLSLILGYRHGVANCIAFNQLDEFYPEHVSKFQRMLEIHKINLPSNVTSNILDENLSKMIQMTKKMERPLDNALGADWRNVLNDEKIAELYLRM